jgi:pSer/pThr/pTyr-binding forkhead associated (FHA) protein
LKPENLKLLMKELWLKYTDDRGETKRVSVSDEIFTIGRHSENDLCIPDNRLSREHARIERYADSFYVSDSNSSNGTTLNGAQLNESVTVKNGDRLNLGGAVEIQIKIADENDARRSARVENASSVKDESAFSPNIAANQVSANNQNISAASDSNSIPTSFFWLAPVFGLVILIFVGGLFFAFSGKKEVAQNTGIEIYTPRTKSPKTDDSPTEETPTPRKNDSPGSSDGTTQTPDSTNTLPTPKVSADAEKVEQNAAAFLRRIAQNDPRAFLTGKQLEIVNSKINSLKGSSALAENFKAVKKNAAQFETLANSKNLKAQFLATATLARIGNVRGDSLAVAQTMLPILSDLKVTLDNKLADDNLMIIAAYERGAAGKPRSLQSTLEALSKQTQNVSPREIRTIWYLKENGKITEAEFDFAVQFLAIGTIMQNPKDFNIIAEAVIFN